MNSNFSINISTNFNNKGQSKKKLTAQEEYWLDRILRNYADKILMMVILFLLVILGMVLFSVKFGTMDRNGIKVDLIEIRK